MYNINQIYVCRYKAEVSSSQSATGDDLTPDYMNILGMIFSMCGLMMRVCILCQFNLRVCTPMRDSDY
jgi:hypothetical protein